LFSFTIQTYCPAKYLWSIIAYAGNLYYQLYFNYIVEAFIMPRDNTQEDFEIDNYMLSSPFNTGQRPERFDSAFYAEGIDWQSFFRDYNPRLHVISSVDSMNIRELANNFES